MIKKESTNFSTTVPRELVHRIAISEVYLTHFVSHATDQFKIGVQWPRDHIFYRTVDGAVDSSLLIETFRQATVLVAHATYSVPLDHKFLLPDIRVVRHRAFYPTSGRPAELLLEMSVYQLQRTVNGASSLRVEGKFFINGSIVGEADAGARIMGPRSYARYRGARNSSSQLGRARPGVSQESVGVERDSNVLLGLPLEENRWPLRIDFSNPVYFDHPLDHVPGTVLIESGRQAVRAFTNNPKLDLQEITVTFESMVELDHHPEVSVVEVGPAESCQTMWQVNIETSGTIQMAALFKPDSMHPFRCRC